MFRVIILIVMNFSTPQVDSSNSFLGLIKLLLFVLKIEYLILKYYYCRVLVCKYVGNEDQFVMAHCIVTVAVARVPMRVMKVEIPPLKRLGRRRGGRRTTSGRGEYNQYRHCGMLSIIMSFLKHPHAPIYCLFSLSYHSCIYLYFSNNTCSLFRLIYLPIYV